MVENEEGESEEQVFQHRDFEIKFFSDKTNQVFCQTFLANALKDPLSDEIGKTIIFCVSQKHASRITQTLNQLADQFWPGQYNSDFALQITSTIANAQDYTVNFSNNNLNGHTRRLEGYKSSKTRVCVTVGMMTTGYDCQDILNLCLMRPIFSPTDFIQMKGRGTRKYNFTYRDELDQKHEQNKANFKLFDFFANCEYFEDKFPYDEVIRVPVKPTSSGTGGTEGLNLDEVTIFDPDQVKTLSEKTIGLEGMRIDRELFDKAKATIIQDIEVKEAVENEQWDVAVSKVREKYEDKPSLYLTLDKIRKSEQVDRRLSWREVLERMFGFIDRFKSKDEKLEEECEKFILTNKPDSHYVLALKNYLKAYIADEKFRHIINSKSYLDLNFYPAFSLSELKSLNGWIEKVPEYVKDYVPLNQFL